MPPKGSKRKATAQNGSAASSKQTKQTGQKNVSKAPNVPIDEGFSGENGPLRVYVDQDNTVFDASLNQSQVAKNNNKVLSFTRWSRR